MEKKYLDLTGLQDVAGHVNTRLKTVTTMPLSADNGAVRLYVGNTTNTYIQGHIYQYDLANTEWKDITATSPSASAYHAAGTKTVAELTSSLLVAANEGNVYNITDSGVTTADFIEGAGKPIRIGDNVGICEPTSGTYKFDLLSGFITIDSVPTDGSTNPVESNGVYDALAEKDANIIANTKLIKDTVGWSGKNLLENKIENATKGTITITHNVDGTITLSAGTSDTSASAPVVNESVLLKKGKYILSSDITNSDIYLRVKIGDNYVNCVDKQIAFELDTDTSVKAAIYIKKDTTISEPIIFKPMIRNADILDDIYEPYRGTTAFPRDEQRVLSAKNLCPKANFVISNGITFTVDNDGVVTANGTSSSNDAICKIPIPSNLEGNFYFSGCPSGGGSNLYDVYMYDATTSARPTKWDGVTTSGTDTGNESEEVKLIQGHSNEIRLRVYKNQTITNLKFKPMLRLSTDLDDTFVPYTKTNKELTDDGFTRTEQRVLGSVNLIKPTVGRELNGVTYTVDANGVVTANGTTSSTTSSNWSYFGFNGDGNTYKFSCGNSNVGLSPTYVGFYVYDETASKQYNIVGTNELAVECIKDHRFVVHIIVRASSTVTDEKFYPMMSLSGGEYIPYAMTNIDLTNLKMDKDPINNGTTALDDTTESGLYYCTTPSDAPDGITYFNMLVMKTNDNSIRQVIFRSITAEAAIYTRAKGSSGWITWYKFSPVDSIKSAYNLTKDTVGWISKNLIEIKAFSQEIEGITFTVNEDGSVIADGTATADAILRLSSNRQLQLDEIEIPTGDYILSGSTGGTSETYYINIRSESVSGAIKIVGDGEDSVTLSTAGRTYGFNIVVKSGVTVNNQVFYPMFRKADIIDSTFEPYHVDVDKYIDTKADKLVKDAVGWSGKNLNKYPYNIESRSNGTVTITPNSDGSLSMTDGTTSASLSFAMQDRSHKDAIWLPIGKYTYSLEYEGTISGGTAKGYVGCTYNGAYLSLSGDVLFGKERTFEITADTQCDNKLEDGSCLVSCYINLATNTTTSNVKVYPMLRKAEILNSTFEPYHKDVDGTINDTLREEKLIKSRNLLKIHINDVKATASGGTWSGNTYTKHDVTFTFSTNEQGYISDIDVDGTASALTQCDLIKLSGSQLKEMLGVSSQKILSGCPKQGSSSTYYLRIRTMNSVTFVTDTSAGVQFNPNSLVDSEIYRIFVDVDNGVSVSHLHFQPMIREAFDGDRTFEPYYIPINENKATERVKDANGWSGKNLMPFPFAYKPNVQEKEGTTITPNEDGSITIVANPSTARSTFTLQERWNPSSMKSAREMVFMPNGDYIFSGGNGNSNIELLIGCSTKGDGATYNNLLTTYTSGKFTVNGSDESDYGAYVQFSIRVANNATINETIHPMITRADVIDQTFEKGHRTVEEWVFPRAEQTKLDAKNLLEIKTTSQTVDTLTATINTNKTVKLVTSSATTQDNSIWLNTNVPLESGVSYILSGGNTINNDYTIEARAFNKDTDIKSLANVTTSLGVKFTPDYNGYDNIRVRIWVKSGVSTSGRTIYPMIRLATDPDDTYVPFAMTNKELTDGKVSWEQQRVLGAKNLDFTGRYNSKNHDITYTINSDGSVTASGTASADSYLTGRQFTATCTGMVKLTGGYNSNYMVYPYDMTDNDRPYADASMTTRLTSDNSYQKGGLPVTFYMIAGHEYKISIRIKNATVLDNVTIYPLLTLLNDADLTYVPPAMTNKDLTDKKFSVEGQRIVGAKNLYNIVATSKTDAYGGVWTVNNDGTFTVSGTPTAYEAFGTSSYNVLPAGTYIASWDNNNVTNVGTDTIRLYKGSTQVRQISIPSATSPVTFDITESDDYDRIKWDFKRITNNVEMSGTLKPMIRVASDADDTYTLFAMTNRELTNSVFEKRVLTSEDNLNDVTETGLYYASSTPTNAPTSSINNFTLLVSNLDGTHISQIVFRSGETNGYIYLRYKPSGSWYQWFKFSPEYTLPVATSSVLGGVKVGNNLTVGNDGTLTVNNLICDFGETPIVIDCESSEEQEVGTWLNQKLYMSAIYCAAVTFNKENDEVQVVHSHGISNINEIIFTSFTVKVANNTWSPLPRKDLYLDINKTDIHGYTTGATEQQKEVKGLVYYTKTS